jgi:hypothetical protein
MMIDSTLMTPSLHAIAELDVSNRDREKCDCDYDPEQILHKRSLKPFPFAHLFLGVKAKQLGFRFHSAWQPCHLNAGAFSRLSRIPPQGVEEIEQEGATRQRKFSKDHQACHASCPESSADCCLQTYWSKPAIKVS